MATELILAGNGPGELSGWVRPVARTVRQLQSGGLRLTLALSPSQFAGGRELEVVRQWDLFDRIIEPKAVVRLALGLDKFDASEQAALVHLGGDLWFSARLARRLGTPACAFAETTLIAGRHRPFTRIFAVSDALAERLVARGVPQDKIIVTGDPRVDALSEYGLWTSWRERPSPQPSPHWASETPDERYIVSSMPGSRDRFFNVLVPYFLGISHELAAMQPSATFQFIVSPFLSPEVVAKARADASRRWPHLAIEWVTDEPWPALVKSDFVLTIPGTNTLELAILGVPFAVVLDTNLIDGAPVEGAMEWIGRIPGLRRPLKRALLTRYLSRQGYMALPNLRAGRALVPEWVGRWTPKELADRVVELLNDARGRAAMATTLRRMTNGTTGASLLIVKHAVALAENGLGAEA